MTSEKLNARLPAIVGLMVLGVALANVLFEDVPNVSKESITQYLQKMGEHAAHEAAIAGKEGKLTFGDINIQGWGYEKYATVSNLDLELTDKSGGKNWGFTTPTITMAPDGVHTKRVNMTLTDPVTISENGQTKMTASFSQPVKWAYSDGIESRKHLIVQSIRFPKQITLTPYKSADDLMGKSTPITITSGNDSVVHTKNYPDLGTLDNEYQMREVTVDTGNGTQISLGELSSHLVQTPGHEHHVDGKYTLTVSDVVLHTVGKASKSYSVVANLDYTAKSPADKPEERSADDGNVDIKLNKVMLADEDFRMTMEGNLTRVSDDRLPSGTIKLAIDNVGKFIASDLIPDMAKHAVEAVLPKIVGEPVRPSDSVTVMLRREKNGVFYVGNITFEEMATSLLAEMVSAMNPLKDSGTAPAAVAAPESPKALEAPKPEEPVKTESPAAGMPIASTPAASPVATPESAAPAPAATPTSTPAGSAAPAPIESPID